MTIVFKLIGSKPKEWFPGEPLTEREFMFIEEITAQDEDLSNIKSLFQMGSRYDHSIPMIESASKMSWFGDMAKVIIKGLLFQRRQQLVKDIPGSLPKAMDLWDEIFKILHNPDVSMSTKETMIREKYQSPIKKSTL